MPRHLRPLLALSVFALAAWPSSGASAVAISVGPQHAVPIALERSQLQGACGVPDAETGDECAVWFSTTSTIGDANWAFVNLNRWDVRPAATCSLSDVGSRGEYIRFGYSSLQVDDTVPTYVCADDDVPTVNFRDLVALARSHDVRPFPVSDCAQELDAGGSPVPCGAGAPDKRAIVGFAPFRVGKVLKGNDPQAIGTPGTPGFCGVRAADPNAICLVLRSGRFRHQPDAAIRDGSPGSDFVGDNIDERWGKGQVVATQIQPGGEATLWVRVENDGRVLERFAVSAPGAFEGWRVKFSYLGDNVTSAIRAGRYHTPLMAPDAFVLLKLRMHPGGGQPLGSRAIALVRIRSGRDGELVDAVRAKVHVAA